MKESYKIAAIEGTCFSGKTTLLRELNKKYGVKIIEEYDHYVGGGVNFPNFPPKTIEEARSAIQFFVEIDKRRTSDAIELSLKHNQPVVIDRSVLSCMAFQKAVDSILPAEINVYEYVAEAFKEQVLLGYILFPTVVVYVEPNDLQTFLNRVALRGRVEIDFLNKLETFELMKLWYKKVLSKYFTEENAIVLKSVDGELDKLVLLTYLFLKTAKFNTSTIESIESKDF